MKHLLSFYLGLILLLIFSPMKFASSNQIITMDETTYQNIFIDATDENNGWGNFDFVLGQGTWDDPYLIENLNVNAGEESSAIRIENSKDFVIIRNCIFTNSGYLFENAGITLIRSDNIRIENCYAGDGYKGLFMMYCDSIQIVNSTFSKNSLQGAFLEACHYDSILGNTFSYNEMGLFTRDSHHETIEYNTIKDSTDEGYSLHNCYEISIKYNIIKGNKGNGLEVTERYNNTISYNRITSNKIGIEIGLGSSLNIVFLNTISNNTLNQGIITSHGPNFWDNGTHGNYWGDYSSKYPNATHSEGFWDSKYIIGTSNNEDNYPLVNAPNLNFTYFRDSEYSFPKPNEIEGESSQKIPGYSFFIILGCFFGISAISLTAYIKKIE